jgi:hypothetical protein
MEYSLIDAYKARTLSVSLKTLKPISKKDKPANINHYYSRDFALAAIAVT